MKKAFSRVAILLSAIGFSSQVYAGGCHLEEVSPSKHLASLYMAEEIRNRVIAIDEEYKKQGKDLQVVMIARSGESLESFDVLKDDPSQPLQKYLNFLTERAYAKVSYSPIGGKRGDTNKPVAVPREFVSNQRLEYSHVGFLMKHNRAEGISPNAPEWLYIVHLLAECDEKSNRYGASDINYEKLNRFFWDTKILDDKDRARKALIIVPQVEIQENLAKLLHDASIGGRGGLHEPKYNVAATPFTVLEYKEQAGLNYSYHQLKDQNSNQWPLEILAAATKEFGQVRNRMQAQDVLHATNYRPSLVLPTGIKGAACTFKRGPFGLWDASNLLNCADQVFRDVGIFQLITVKSLQDYMARNQYLLAFGGQSDVGTAVFVASKEKVKELDEDGKSIERLTEEAKELAERERNGDRRDPRGGRPGHMDVR